MNSHRFSKNFIKLRFQQWLLPPRCLLTWEPAAEVRLLRFWEARCKLPFLSKHLSSQSTAWFGVSIFLCLSVRLAIAISAFRCARLPLLHQSQVYFLCSVNLSPLSSICGLDTIIGERHCSLLLQLPVARGSSNIGEKIPHRKYERDLSNI